MKEKRMISCGDGTRLIIDVENGRPVRVVRLNVNPGGAAWSRDLGALTWKQVREAVVARGGLVSEEVIA